jgi:membrane-bound lytic murein transglycosylase B
MQFIPSTWAAYRNGGNINDNHDAIIAAGRYLAASGGTTNIDRALYSYNPSTHYVAAIKDYADVLIADPRAYDGYFAWQVYVTTTAGTTRLPEGWRRP